VAETAPATGAESPLHFPCDWPLKIAGRNTPEFTAVALAVVRRHCPQVATPEQRASGGGKYLALSLNLHLDSREQMDALYRDLAAAPEVLWAL
jgi:hypothetical protein